MRARRTVAAGVPLADAMASASTPSSAPCRSSPVISLRRNVCSSSVARSKSAPRRRCRSRPAPDPATDVIRAKVSSTSQSVSDGVAAGAGRALAAAAWPRPSRRCRTEPARNATPGSISSGASARSASARRPIFPSRAVVVATRVEVTTRSWSRMGPNRSGRRGAVGQAGRGGVVSRRAAVLVAMAAGPHATRRRGGTRARPLPSTCAAVLPHGWSLLSVYVECEPHWASPRRG
jgi:hypothetical protein